MVPTGVVVKGGACSWENELLILAASCPAGVSYRGQGTDADWLGQGCVTTNWPVKDASLGRVVRVNVALPSHRRAKENNGLPLWQRLS